MSVMEKLMQFRGSYLIAFAGAVIVYSLQKILEEEELVEENTRHQFVAVSVFAMLCLVIWMHRVPGQSYSTRPPVMIPTL